MISIKLNATDLGAINGKFIRLERYKPTQALMASGIELKRRAQRNFGSRGAEFNHPWPKRKHSYPWPILQKTGNTRKSFVVNASGRKVELTNKSPYAVHLHYGTKYMPPRPLFKVDKRAKDDLINRARAEVLEVMRRG